MTAADVVSIDGRTQARLKRHTWILETVSKETKSQGITRADLTRRIYMTWGVSVQVCRDDVNDLVLLELLAIGIPGQAPRPTDKVMLTEEGAAYLKSQGTTKEGDNGSSETP